MFITYLIIFLLAAIPMLEIAAIIPVGIIGGLPAVPVMVTAFVGNLVTIILLIVFLDEIRKWRRKKKKVHTEKEAKRQKRAQSLWSKYGLFGLAFIGPFFVGSHLSALLAITFGNAKRQTLIYMTASLLTWTVLIGVASHYGFDYFVADEDDLGFITRLLKIEE